VGGIAVLDPGARKLRRLVRIGDPTDLALTKNWLWVADADRNKVWRVDRQTGQKTAALKVNRRLVSIAANEEDGVWALSRNSRTGVGKLTQIEPERVKAEKVIRVDGDPQEIAIRDGRVWVTQGDANTVTAIKP
jgi:DNA-binding beta-propeller fold protein YncE